jgi:voltage-gated potassium channel Kch
VGHITEETVGLITLVGLITIGLSTYLILYSHPIYEFLSPVLKIFERKSYNSEVGFEHIVHNRYDIIIIGFGRFGSKVAEILDQHQKISYLAIDFDPQVIKEWQAKGKDITYGDMEDPEILEQIPFSTSKCVISTVAEVEPSRHLIKMLRSNQYKGKVYLSALKEKELDLLQECGADKVLIPHHMAATNFYNAYLKKVFDEIPEG